MVRWLERVPARKFIVMEEFFMASNNGALLDHKTILITGGTGSFGKCFTKYALTHYDPKKNHYIFKG